jgi:hypothetical protein
MMLSMNNKVDACLRALSDRTKERVQKNLPKDLL